MKQLFKPQLKMEQFIFKLGISSAEQEQAQGPRPGRQEQTGRAGAALSTHTCPNAGVGKRRVVVSPWKGFTLVWAAGTSSSFHLEPRSPEAPQGQAQAQHQAPSLLPSFHPHSPRASPHDRSCPQHPQEQQPSLPRTRRAHPSQGDAAALLEGGWGGRKGSNHNKNPPSLFIRQQNLSACSPSHLSPHTK